MGLVVIEASMWLLCGGFYCMTMTDKLCYIAAKSTHSYLAI